MKASVVCFGDNCMDLYSVPASRRFVGGNAVNTAVHCRESGCETSYVGAVGKDENGALIINKLKEKNIDVSQVQYFETETAWTKVSLDGGERTFTEEYFGPAEEFQLTDAVLEYLSEHSIIHNTWQGGTKNWLPLFREKCGNLISLDFGERYSEDFLRSCIPYVDLAFFSMDPDHYEKAEEFAKSIHKMGPGYVVVTVGSRGACFSEKDGFFEFVPAEKIQVVDTLGAGDTFIGTFLGYFVRGTAYDKCLREATKAAAQNCMLFGGFKNSEVTGQRNDH